MPVNKDTMRHSTLQDAGRRDKQVACVHFRCDMVCVSLCLCVYHRELKTLRKEQEQLKEAKAAHAQQARKFAGRYT